MPEFSPLMKIVMSVVGLLVLAAIIYAFIKLKFLRGLAVVLMSFAAAFTLLGGAGTSCVALNPTGFGGGFTGIAPYQWLWILFVLIGIAAGIMGVRAVVMLVKARKHAYRDSLIALLVAVLINAVHLFASRALRGSSMPVDMVLYTNVLALVIFLIFRIPGVWQKTNLERPDGEGKSARGAAALALIAVGILTLTIQYMMAPTHTIAGINYADVWHYTMTFIGTILILAGILSALLVEIVFLRQKKSIKA